MNIINQSTAVTIQFGPYLDAASGITAETGITAGAGIELSKAGATFGSRNSSTGLTHDADGWYFVHLDTTDTNTLGSLIVKAASDDIHLPVWREFTVVPANIYNSFVGGTDNLNVNTIEIDSSLTAASNLRLGSLTMVSGQVSGVATLTNIPTNLTETTNDHYNGRSLAFTTGSLVGQVRAITDYVGSNKALTVETLTEIPSSGDSFIII